MCDEKSSYSFVKSSSVHVDSGPNWQHEPGHSSAYVQFVLYAPNCNRQSGRTEKHYPGWGLAVNFRKKCVEMRWKKIIFTAYFLHLFAVNAVNRGELFIFTAFSVFLQKRILLTRVWTSDLLHAFHCLVHCANFNLRIWKFSWI